MKRLELRGYYVRWLAADPGVDYDNCSRKRRPRMVKPQPQTEAQRLASQADDLTWEEFLSRGYGR